LQVTLWLYECLWKQFDPAWIVELGTGNAATATYLSVYSHLHRIPFVSVEQSVEPGPNEARLIALLGGTLIRGDMFGRRTKRRIKAVVEAKPGFLLCDGGDKPKEIRVFSEMCAAGTVIAGHDLGTEWQREDVADVPNIERLEPWHSEAVELSLLCGVFKVI
jgi:hypothetical protein